MPRELDLYLGDIIKAGKDAIRFTGGMSYDDYLANDLVRAAVERKLTIIGEALNQTVQYYPEMEGRIDRQRAIVAFRHRVMHGYFSVNDELLWSIVKTELDGLIQEIASLRGGSSDARS